jgi:hypothetical protein
MPYFIPFFKITMTREFYLRLKLKPINIEGIMKNVVKGAKGAVNL